MHGAPLSLRAFTGRELAKSLPVAGRLKTARFYCVASFSRHLPFTFSIRSPWAIPVIAR